MRSIGFEALIFNLMRTILFFVLALFAATGARAGEQILYVYTWEDYFDSEVIARFEKTHGCSVVLSFFDSNENLHNTLRRDGGSFDVLTPSSYMTRTLYGEGFLADLDHALLPNLRHLAPAPIDLGDDPDMRFSVPYARSVTGVGYDRNRVPESLTGSWDIFNNAITLGKTALLTDMRECLGSALKSLGHSLNSVDPDEIAEAGAVLRRWKRTIDLFDVEGGKAGLIDGEYPFIQNYNGDILQAMMENPDLGFFVPREGTAVTTDGFAISSESPMKELAHAFINHMLDPAVALQNMKTILYYMPNAAALAKLPPEIRDSPAFSVDPAILEKSEVIRTVGEANAIYEEVWRDVVSSAP